jgi:hypothetical protein
VGLCRTVIMALAHLTHGVRTIVDALLRARRFRSSGWLHPALCTLASSLVIAPIAGLASVARAENQPLPPSVLILDQSSADSPWYADFSADFRSTLNAGSERHFSVYSEHLDLSRFPGTKHHEVPRTYLQNKYRDRPIGVLVISIVLGVATMVLAQGSAVAQGRWCAQYSGGSSNCGFNTYRQCRSDVRGVGGSCRRNLSRR